MYSMPYLFSKT